MSRDLFVVVTVALMGFAAAQDANCDFSQNLAVGETVTLQSPDYPNNYTAGIQCRWLATCPEGYNCVLDCPEINIPQSDGCSEDSLLISTSGDDQLVSADTYCGYGSVTATSTGRRLSVGLLAADDSVGGRFSCTVETQVAASSTCSCGYKKTNRIVGGVETGVNEYPMVAALWDKRIDDIHCGAVIIYNHYLATAAHCLYGEDYNNFQIVVGKHNISASNPDTSPTQRFEIQDAIIHPDYDPDTYDYDIALILTNQSIVFSDRVGPVCLPFKYTAESFAGDELTVLGWGTLFSGGPTSQTLQEVNLDVISQSQCSASVSPLTQRQLCTYTENKDACQYDSGGPLLYTDPDTALLFYAAAISNGDFCANGTPGVNTRITEMLNWILASTPDADYCRK